MFKKFFNKVKTFIDTIWNGVKKIGKFVKNHYNPMVDTLMSDDYLKHYAFTLGVFYFYGITYYFIPSCFIIGKCVLAIELIMMILTAICDIYKHHKNIEVSNNV